jgi:hypothetical protein
MPNLTQWQVGCREPPVIKSPRTDTWPTARLSIVALANATHQLQVTSLKRPCRFPFNSSHAPTDQVSPVRKARHTYLNNPTSGLVLDRIPCEQHTASITSLQGPSSIVRCSWMVCRVAGRCFDSDARYEKEMTDTRNMPDVPASRMVVLAGACRRCVGLGWFAAV